MSSLLCSFIWIIYLQDSVINDPLGQTHSAFGSDHFFTWIFLWQFWKVGTNGRHVWKKVITSGRVDQYNHIWRSKSGYNRIMTVWEEIFSRLKVLGSRCYEIRAKLKRKPVYWEDIRIFWWQNHYQYKHEVFNKIFPCFKVNK